jgi:uncharacterized protein YkwD
MLAPRLLGHVAVLLLTTTTFALVAAAPASAAAHGTRIPRTAAQVDRLERVEVALINRYRRSHGLHPLRIDGTLTRAAGWMALDLGRTARFSHTDSLGRDPFTRLRAFGYPSSDTWRGENLAAGDPRPVGTRRQWINSPPHRANLLGARFRAIGIARVRVPGSPYRWYWATTFGSRWTSPPA